MLEQQYMMEQPVENSDKNPKHEEPKMIPFFVAESTSMHLSKANKRMLLALIVVCITFIITIVVFVVGYTIREQHWLNTLLTLSNNTPVSEVLNGVYQ